MKMFLLRTFADKFALVADVSKPSHVRLLHWIKNQCFKEMLLQAAIREGYAVTSH